MIISQEAVDLIKQFEGFRPRPYKDSANISTIGYGSTVYPDGRRVRMSDPPISRKKAEEMMLFHLNKEVLPYLDKYLDVPQEQNQVDALASLVYNIGAGNFKTSSLRRRINDEAPISVIEMAWKVWRKSKGKTLTGLVLRRAKEWAHYIK